MLTQEKDGDRRKISSGASLGSYYVPCLRGASGSQFGIRTRSIIGTKPRIAAQSDA